MPGQHPDLVKVLLPNDECEVERLWASPVGDNCFELDNNPWYAYSVSAGDIVEAVADRDDEWLTFVRVVKKSGNRTVRVVFEWPARGNNLTRRVLDHLNSLGCDYEGMEETYFSVNIPQDADFPGVCEYFTSQEVQWEHAIRPTKRCTRMIQRLDLQLSNAT